MKSAKINMAIYKFVLKKRKFITHLLFTFLTFGLWFIFYYFMKLSFIINTTKCDYCNNTIPKNSDFCPYCDKAILKRKYAYFQNTKKLDSTNSIQVSTYIKINEKNDVSHKIHNDIYLKNKSKNYPNNYVVIDTETTGLQPEIDGVIEISAIKYVNGEPIDFFTQLINPEQKLDSFIVKLTGIKNSDLLDKPTIDKVLPMFFDFVEEYTLVAHNISYDIKMIACEANRINVKMIDNKLIDTLTLAKKMIPKYEISNYKLSTLKEYYGVNTESHRATDDCITCNAIYQKYIEFLKFKNEKIDK